MTHIRQFSGSRLTNNTNTEIEARARASLEAKLEARARASLEA